MQPAVTSTRSPDLSPETLLQIAPGVRTRFDALGHVLVETPDGAAVDIGPRGFVTLSLFAEPRMIGEVIGRLKAGDAGSADLLPTVEAIGRLIKEGALVRPGSPAPQTSGWSDPVEHGRMLHDDRRTLDYLAAVTQVVRPEDVVLEIGTGSGILAVAAARAGARRVYAVEASDIAEVAERVFAANGVEDRVTLIRGWSRTVELPEQADLLVTELIGNEPLGEDILETTLDARRRFLRPEARLLPRALRLLVRPLELPETEMRERAIAQDAVDRWRKLYGIDLQPLRETAPSRPVNYPTEAAIAASWPQAGPPVVLVELDLTTLEDVSVDASAELVIEKGRAVNAVAVTFHADLHGNVTHTFDPWIWRTSSWATSVWVLPEPLRVEPGQALRVQYCRRITGRFQGLTCEVVEHGEG